MWNICIIYIILMFLLPFLRGANISVTVFIIPKHTHTHTWHVYTHTYTHVTCTHTPTHVGFTHTYTHIHTHTL